MLCASPPRTHVDHARGKGTCILAQPDCRAITPAVPAIALPSLLPNNRRRPGSGVENCSRQLREQVHGSRGMYDGGCRGCEHRGHQRVAPCNKQLCRKTRASRKQNAARRQPLQKWLCNMCHSQQTRQVFVIMRVTCLGHHSPLQLPAANRRSDDGIRCMPDCDTVGLPMAG
jgi:hypothetical protein